MRRRSNMSDADADVEAMEVWLRGSGGKQLSEANIQSALARMRSGDLDDDYYPGNDRGAQRPAKASKKASGRSTGMSKSALNKARWARGDRW